jgi:NADH:ubiquinone oxidoreductase subunit 4 (subunit M)
MSAGQGIVLFVLVIAILFLGIYPEPVIHLTQSTVTDILSRMSLK